MKKIIILLLFISTFLINKNSAQVTSISVFQNGSLIGSFQNGTTVYVSPSASSISFTANVNNINFTTYPSWSLNGSGIRLNEGSYSYSSSNFSECENFLITFYSYSFGPFSIFISRIPPSPSINGPTLCEGQSANFSTNYFDNTISYNWSGSGGVNVSSNNYQAFVSLNSPGYLYCTANNQCGSRTNVTSKMGAPEYNDVQIYNFNQYINPGGTKALTSASNSSWSTYYGNFDGNQNASGGLVWYTANYAPEQIIYLTHSNSCGSLTREFSLYTNPDWQPNRIVKGNKELINFSEGNTNTTLLNVYPNPAINTLNLQLPESYSLIKKEITYENIIEKAALYDKQGNLVRNINDSELQDIISNKKIAIDIKNLLPNEYYLHVTNKKGKIEKIRVLIGDK